MTPSGRGDRLGTMKRAALWLRDTVGEGNIFTKQKLREQFPGVEQADRRMRDLRNQGWIIHTNRHDPTLAPNELRFVKAGNPVWEKGATQRTTGVSAATRREVLARDSHLCVVCGISSAEPYDDAPHQTATLTVVSRGEGDDTLVTECRRCRSGGSEAASDDAAVRALVADLDAGDRARLALWARTGRRDQARLDRAWGAFRQLPEPQRRAIAAELRNGVS